MSTSKYSPVNTYNESNIINMPLYSRSNSPTIFEHTSIFLRHDHINPRLSQLVTVNKRTKKHTVIPLNTIYHISVKKYVFKTDVINLYIGPTRQLVQIKSKKAKYIYDILHGLCIPKVEYFKY